MPCRLCKLLRCSKQEASQFTEAWERSSEGQRWMEAAADRPKKALAHGSVESAMPRQEVNEKQISPLATISDSDGIKDWSS